MKALKNDRSKQVEQLHKRVNEILAAESSSRKSFEDEIQSSLITIVSSDESRRACFQLIQEEQQQNIAVCSRIPNYDSLFQFTIFIISSEYKKLEFFHRKNGCMCFAL